MSNGKLMSPFADEILLGSFLKRIYPASMIALVVRIRLAVAFDIIAQAVPHHLALGPTIPVPESKTQQARLRPTGLLCFVRGRDHPFTKRLAGSAQLGT